MEIIDNALTSTIRQGMYEKLTPNQTRFVKAYDGDLIYALRVAGYRGDDKYLRQLGEELLSRPDIQYHIQRRRHRNEKREGVLLSKLERMEFLSALIRNTDPYEVMVKDDYGEDVPPPPPSISERLKALDMYNKMEGDYHTNVNINHNISMTDLVLSSFVDQQRPIEAIEAEYIEMKESGGTQVAEVEPTVEDILGL